MVSRLGLGSMRQSLSSVKFQVVTKWIRNSAQHHTAGPAPCQKLQLWEESVVQFVALHGGLVSLLSHSHQTPQSLMSYLQWPPKFSFSCSCFLCTFRVLLVLLGELCPPLVLTHLRWLFLPSTGGSASTQIRRGYQSSHSLYLYICHDQELSWYLICLSLLTQGSVERHLLWETVSFHR